MSNTSEFNNTLRKFKLVFLGEQSGLFYIRISLGSSWKNVTYNSIYVWNLW